MTEIEMCLQTARANRTRPDRPRQIPTPLPATTTPRRYPPPPPAPIPAALSLDVDAILASYHHRRTPNTDPDAGIIAPYRWRHYTRATRNRKRRNAWPEAYLA